MNFPHSEVQPEQPDQPEVQPEAQPEVQPEQPEQPKAPDPPVQEPARQRDVESELSQMRAQLEQLQQKAATGQLSRQPVDEDLQSRVGELRDTYADWPQPGDKFAERPQPHDLKALELPQPGVTRDHLPPGEPDTLSPVVIGHRQPTIGPGQAGEPVSHLAGLLAKLGYPTSISRGQNHAFTFDESVAHAVEAFKNEWHVIEDSSGFRTVEEAARVAGPWVWEALLRATGAAA